MDRLTDLVSRSLARAGAAGRANAALKLTPLDEFGHNPGALQAKYYRPEKTGRGGALVVVLHGCTQTAEHYAAGAGWLELADEAGFTVLCPEQQRSNNPNLCFNWFLPQDNRRDRGEALSISNMVRAMIERHGVDPDRVFVTGLSAGGGMANVMLATYPELFAGGAIIAGLPYGTATTVPQAFERMHGQGLPSKAALGALVAGATDHRGPWPTISVWQGTADPTVSPSNATAIVEQWQYLHGLGQTSTRRDTVNGYPRDVWCDQDGRICIESYSIAGMGHGTPIVSGGTERCGAPGPYLLDKQISSTRHICRFWNLAHAGASMTETDALETAARPPAKRPLASNDARPRLSRMLEPEQTAGAARATGVGKVIEDALRAAGLMR